MFRRAGCPGSAVVTIGAFAILIHFAGSSTADTRPDAPEPPAGIAALEAVTVKGRKRERVFEERVSTFVSSVTVRSHTESLARWQVPVCPFVTGAAAEQNEYMRQHLRQIARDAGAPLGSSECGANLVVVLSKEPEALLRDWWSQDHRMFSHDRGVGGVERFLRSEAPVRAWYNACSVSPRWAKSNAHQRVLPCDTGEPGSRLSWGSVRAIYSVIVVVDFGRIGGLDVGQIADYVAVIGLAQIRPGSELGRLPTILRLFSEAGAARPRALSSWDKSFLRSLYATESGNVAQLSQIKNRMGSDLGGSGPDPTAAIKGILARVNLITPGAGRVDSYTEVGAHYDGEQGPRSALVNFEAQLSFVAETYYHGERKPGDHVQVYGDVEYLDEGDGWRLLGLSLFPR